VSRIKNISRTGWLVAGFIAALLLVPTTAVAVTSATVSIIKSGGGSGEASVTTAHQLLTTTVDPKAYVNTTGVDIGGATDITDVAAPPSGSALIITTIHIDTYNDTTPGTSAVTFFIWRTRACGAGGGGDVGSYNEVVTPGSLGETDIPFSPGLAVPAGGALCALVSGGLSAQAMVTGYTVPSGEVPARPLHALPALSWRHR
jgi:hypothetical protein